MQLSESLETLHEFDYEGHTERFLYDSMMSEYKHVLSRNSTVFYEKLWATVAPAGNIYRYVGLQCECLRHSFDLGAQVDALAAEHGHLLAGAGSPEGEVREALKRATVRRRDSPDPYGHPAGFKPVEEFLIRPVVSSLGILCPRDSAAFREWLILRLITWQIWAIQMGVPMIILVDEWYAPSDGMQIFKRFLRHPDWYRLVCVPPNLRDSLHTVMGGALLALVLLVIHSYALDQREHSFKSGRLATDRFWYIVGHCTNIWCCLFTALAVPCRFWADPNATNIVTDALALMLVFTLDDLLGHAAAYLGKSDKGFQRAVAWQAALLSQCPVDVRDIVNPHAATIDELWCIGFDSSGQLEAAQADPPEPQHAQADPPEPERAPPRPCARRLMRRRKTEASALLPDADRPEFSYAWSTTESAVLPRLEARILPYCWRWVDRFFVCFQVMAPLVWMTVNKPCKNCDAC